MSVVYTLKYLLVCRSHIYNTHFMYLFYLLSGEEAFDENVTDSYILHYEDTVLRLHNNCVHAIANFPCIFFHQSLIFHSAEQAISQEHKTHLYNKRLLLLTPTYSRNSELACMFEFKSLNMYINHLR